MGECMRLGNPPIEVQVKRSNRAKRLSLRVSRLDGRISLTVPQNARQKDAIAFLQEREPWLRKHLDQVAVPELPVFGSMISFEGRQVMLRPAGVRRPMIEHDAIILPENPARMPAYLRAFLREQARIRLTSACDHYATKLGRPYSKLTLRDTRSRWGSCTSDGNLMFSWRLIMAPSEILQYVAAHEVAHLVEMNHSTAYWAVCGRLYPEYKAARKWLRTQGNALHQLQI